MMNTNINNSNDYQHHEEQEQQGSTLNKTIPLGTNSMMYRGGETGDAIIILLHDVSSIGSKQVGFSELYQGGWGDNVGLFEQHSTLCNDCFSIIVRLLKINSKNYQNQINKMMIPGVPLKLKVV